MAIALDIDALGDISSFDGLKTAVENWLDRDDLSDQVPYFIALAEARFRRIILALEREVTITFAAAASQTLPDDFLSIRRLGVTGERRGLEQTNLIDFRNTFSNMSGDARAFAITGDTLLVAPDPDPTTTLTMTYEARFVPLSNASQSNWLLVDHPDVYLFGALLQGEAFGWNDERIPLFKAAVDEAIGEINDQANRKRYGSAPLVMQGSVNEAARGAYRR